MPQENMDYHSQHSCISYGYFLFFFAGEKGRLAFEKMDKICCELREAMYQEAEIEITIF